MSAKIIINRKSELLNRGRRYKVIIDGQEAGSVGNDNAEEFVVEPGKHTVQSAHSWYKTSEFDVDVADNTSCFLKIRTGLTLYFPLYISLLIGAFFPIILKYMKVERAYWWSYAQIILIVPFVLYMLYFILINRKKYLVIEKDTDNVFNR